MVLVEAQQTKAEPGPDIDVALQVDLYFFLSRLILMARITWKLVGQCHCEEEANMDSVATECQTQPKSEHLGVLDLGSFA